MSAVAASASDRGRAAAWLPWLVGLAFVAVFVPPSFLDGSARFLATAPSDFGQHQTGILAYLHDAWHWPPFHTNLLDAPDGAALVYLDALPGPSFIAKAALTLTGLEIPLLGWWIVLVYLLQPVAMARLLRALGVTDWLPILCGSLIALACSWFLWRFGHTALSSHFLLLFGLAFAVEAGRAGNPRPALLKLGLLAIAGLFVHAYLFAMVAGLLLPALAGLALQRRLPWRTALGGIAAWVTLTVGAMALLGYLAFAPPLPGFKYFAMNLLSPFVPQMSGLWPDFATTLLPAGRPPMGDWMRQLGMVRPVPGVGDMIDATGGQYEGYAWFGFGLWPLLLLGVWLNRRSLPGLLRRQWPLLVAVLGMACFALGGRVFIAYAPWFSLDWVPEPLKTFRSSGRFIWPLVYLAAAVAVAAVARQADRRWIAGALVLLTLMQLADARLWYQRLWLSLRLEPEPRIETAIWRPIVERHRLLLMESELDCDGADWNSIVGFALLAAELGRGIDEMQISRMQPSRCAVNALALPGLRPAPDELLLLTGAWREFQRGRLTDAVAATCRAFEGGYACTQRWPELEAAGLAGGFHRP